MRIPVVGVLASVVLAIAAAEAPAQRVNVRYRDARAEERNDDGNIDKWTFKSMLIKIGRGDREISNDDIVDVTFLSPPDGFNDIQKNHKEASWLDVADAAKAALDGKLKKSEEWAREHLLFWSWDASYHLQRFDDAEKIKAALLQEFPETHFLPRLELIAPAIEFAMGRFIEAEGVYAEFARRAESRGYARRFVLEAGLGRARCLLALDRAGPAGDAIAEIKSKAGSNAERNLIELAEADVLVAQKKYSDAERIYERMLDNTDFAAEPLVVARASNGLGESLYNQKKWKEAAFAFSRTFALFRTDPRAESEVGWAFFRFSTASLQFANSMPEANADRDSWRARAQFNRQRAAEDFEFTRGGQEARRELGLKPREPGKS